MGLKEEIREAQSLDMLNRLIDLVNLAAKDNMSRKTLRQCAKAIERKKHNMLKSKRGRAIIME